MAYTTRHIEDKKALLAAVRVLTNHGHYLLAQQLWDAQLKPHSRTLLPGEHQ